MVFSHTYNYVICYHYIKNWKFIDLQVFKSSESSYELMTQLKHYFKKDIKKQCQSEMSKKKKFKINFKLKLVNFIIHIF